MEFFIKIAYIKQKRLPLIFLITIIFSHINIISKYLEVNWKMNI